MTLRTKKILRALIIGLALVLVAIASGLLPLRLDFLEGPIAAVVRKATGLEFDLDGPLLVRLGPRAGVSVRHVVLATPGGDSLVELYEGEAGMSIVALLRGRLHFRDIIVTGLRADLCTTLPERPERAAGPTGEPPTIIVEALEVSNIEFFCEGESANASIDRIAATAPASGPIEIEASASVAGNPTHVTATGGMLAQLLGQQPFPFDAKIEMEQGSVLANGEFAWDAGKPVFDAQLALDVADARLLGEAFDLAVPDIGTVGIEAAVRASLERLEILDLSGALGKTQVSATGAADMPGDRLRIEFSALSGQLDLEPFMAAPSEPNSKPADLRPLFDTLRQFDAVVAIRIDEIVGLPVNIRAASVEAALADGIFAVNSAEAAVLDGQVGLTGELDVRPVCPSLDLVAEVDSVALSGLREAGWLAASLDGQIARARATSNSCGTSLSGHLEQLAATVTATGGRIVVASEWPVDVVKLDVALKPSEPIRASASAVFEGEPVEIEAQTGALKALGGDDPWPVSLVAKGARSELRVEGTTRFATGPIWADVLARFSVPRIGSLHRWLGVGPDTAETLLATTRLQLDAARLVADDITIELGSTDLNGALTWRHAATPQTLAVNLRSDFIDVDKIRRMFGEAGPAVAGADNQARRTGAGAGWQGLPPIDLDLAFAAVRGGPVDVTDLAIRGRLRKGLVDNASVTALVEDELSLRGVLDIDVRQIPATLRFDAEAGNADLGRLLRRLELVDDLAMRADSMLLRVGSTGDSLQTALENLRVDATVRRFAWDIPRKSADADFEVRLDTLALLMQPGQPLGASTRGIIDGIPVELWIQSPGLGSVLGDTEELPLRVVAAAEDDVAMIDLLLDRSAENEIRGHVELSGQVVEAGGRDLSALVPPLADYALKGKLLVSDTELSLSDLEAHLGSSKARGKVSLSGDGRQRLAIELRSPRLQADDWIYLPTFSRAEPAATADMPPPEDDARTVESPATRRGPLLVINELIERYQANYDLDLSVAIDELYAGRDLIGGAEARLFIDEQEFRLRPVTIRLPGGSLDAEYGWRNVDGQVTAGLKANADRLVYGGLLKLVDPTLEAHGALFVDVDIQAKYAAAPGRSELDLLLANADGTIDVAAWPENFEAGILDLWTANLVFALLPAPTDDDASRLNCVVARLEAKDGLLKTKNVLMDSTGTIIRGRGTIDLKQRELDLLVTPQAKREKFLSASTPVAVTGPFDDFQVGVAPAGFLGTVLKWYTSLIYVPYKWLTGKRFPEDGTETCFDVMDWELTPGLEAYFRERDFSAPPTVD